MKREQQIVMRMQIKATGFFKEKFFIFFLLDCCMICRVADKFCGGGRRRRRRSWSDLGVDGFIWDFTVFNFHLRKKMGFDWHGRMVVNIENGLAEKMHNFGLIFVEKNSMVNSHLVKL